MFKSVITALIFSIGDILNGRNKTEKTNKTTYGFSFGSSTVLNRN